MGALFGLLTFMGMEKKRMRLEWVSAGEGAKFAAVMGEFVADVLALGKNKRYGEKILGGSALAVGGTDG
jgi:coenzyme F420-reducing hydrogenase delta subunit